MLKKLKELLHRDPEQFRIPRSVQEVIPLRTAWKSGIFLVGPNRYSRTWQFSDINYALAGEEDQKSMLLGYSGLLNLCDSNASTKFSVVTRKLNRRDFEDYIMIPYANDGHDHYRREYNAMLLEKASHASGMIRDLYITVTITRKSYKDAESYFVRAGAEFTLALSRLGSRCTELNMMDRLRVLHGFYRHGEEADFHFDPALSMKLGHSFQDYICPDSFEFDRDHFRMGDRYGRVLFLKDYAAYLRDDILSELSGIDRPMILSIDVVPIPMDKAIRDSESRLLGVERNIVDFLRKQQANNNFSGTVPYDMEKQRAEMKEFLDDLTIRDQRMMLGMLTLVHTADSKEQLDADTDYIMNAATGRMCQMATLRFQQMDGLNTALPIGVQKLDILRTFTSESLAALMPFRVQEIMEPGGIYYGENAISGNLLLCNRANLLNRSRSLRWLRRTIFSSATRSGSIMRWGKRLAARSSALRREAPTISTLWIWWRATATAAIPWWTNPSLSCPSLNSWTGAASALCKRASSTGAWMPCMRHISGAVLSQRCAFCGRSCWSSRRRKPVIWRWRWSCSPPAVWMPLPMRRTWTRKTASSSMTLWIWGGS